LDKETGVDGRHVAETHDDDDDDDDEARGSAHDGNVSCPPV